MAGLKDWKGKRAVVTGASAGIGEALALEIARRGARVALVARRADRLEGLAQKIRAAGGEASVHGCDVAERAQVEAAAREITARWGGVDVLVNNAGYVRHVLFKDHDVADIEQMTRVNFLGPVYWIKALLPALRAKGAGWIVNISSFAGVTPQPDEAAYCATKYALTGLSDSLVHEFEPLGIHVLAVHPVLVRTDMFTPEINERMPKGTEAVFISAEAFVAEVLRALERGETSIVVPRRFGAVPVALKLFPRRVGRMMARAKLADLPDLKS